MGAGAHGQLSRPLPCCWAARCRRSTTWGPEQLGIPRLAARARSDRVAEVILALNATVDGLTTAHYITDRLAEAGVRVTRLAHGVPCGGGSRLPSRQHPEPAALRAAVGAVRTGHSPGPSRFRRAGRAARPASPSIRNRLRRQAPLHRVEIGDRGVAHLATSSLKSASAAARRSHDPSSGVCAGPPPAAVPGRGGDCAKTSRTGRVTAGTLAAPTLHQIGVDGKWSSAKPPPKRAGPGPPPPPAVTRSKSVSATPARRSAASPRRRPGRRQPRAGATGWDARQPATASRPSSWPLAAGPSCHSRISVTKGVSQTEGVGGQRPGAGGRRKPSQDAQLLRAGGW